MWDQWKRKLKDLFGADSTEVDGDKNNNKPSGQDIHSKVMYHYPERKSFRFPVIPDESSREATTDAPAFRRREKTRRTNESNRPQTSERTERRQARTQRPLSKVNKKDVDTPFRPSKVASPIYGYQQRRSEKKMEQVPAFVRKQEAMEKQGTSEQEDFKEDYSPNREKEPHFEERVNNEPIHKHKPVINPDSQAGPPKESRVTRNQTKEIPEQRNTRKERRKPDQKHVPFNVMMSANDKRRQQEKSRHKASSIMKTETINQIPYHLLNDPTERSSQDLLWVKNQQELLEKTLKHFNVRAKVVNSTQGPSVTRFEVQPEMGVKVSKVKNLSDDLKLNLAAKDIRIEAPIPGKNTIGIEIPNPNPQMVGLQEIFSKEAFQQNKSALTIGLGLTIEGIPSITNIQKMPHGLIAGATGSGKSVCINTILISLLYKANHEDVKFLLIDPKMVELAPYNGIPHLISPVITDVKAATMALKWAVNEMEARYDKFVQEGVRDIERFNEKVRKQQRTEEKMPFIVIVIDELADLMMVSPQDVEDAICRIAQKARACGIHLLLATQRPSVDVITGLIKANIPTRIAFSVSSQVDSRTIIDTSGAEKLLGKGDMLFVENGAGKSIRLQGAFVSDEEIERITDYARSIAEPNYAFEQEQLLEQVTTDEQEDELLQTAIQFVIDQNNASTSLLQRHFKVGYNRAARLMDSMEARGVISGQNGSKPREILVSGGQLQDTY